MARLRDLNVISRASVSQYRDTERSIPEIANELNVGTVMEGSVRYAGDRVRIAAQLIDAQTDEHLWSDLYVTANHLAARLELLRKSGCITAWVPMVYSIAR